MEMRVEADSMSLMAESDSLSLGLHAELLATSVAGRFASAQVYFSGPDAWVLPTILVRLYGRVAGARVLLAETSLASTTCTQEDGKSTALVIAVRGVHVEGFEVVVAQDDDEGAAVADGQFLLVASGAADSTDIRPGLPASLQPPVAQGAPAAPSGRWPVFLSDGVAESGSATNALHVQKSDRRAAYYASAIVGSGTTEASGQSVFYVWNNNTSKRAEIRRVTVAYLGGMGGNLTVKGAHITQEASPAGGTSVTPLPLDPSDAASAMTSVKGATAPTRVAMDLIAFAVPFSATGTFVWTWTDLGKPIVLPAGSRTGFEIRIDVSVTATTEVKLHVSIEWLEV